ncbi:hypothetical protein GIB67_020501 [Kingdonia uniflora]|uniref:Uncharacterized protein n=1 Tax=Kingdonia uniflora TaxID=39325 RepID=A0A7J7PBH8_9MAGN|nr:hypothetical protein GIB67_020501 [Kingdonia uniflora]
MLRKICDYDLAPSSAAKDAQEITPSSESQGIQVVVPILVYHKFVAMFDLFHKDWPNHLRFDTRVYQLFYKKLTRSDVHTCLEPTGENIPFFAHDLIQHGFGDTVNVDIELIAPRGRMVYAWYYWSGSETIRVIIMYSIKGDAW